MLSLSQLKYLKECEEEDLFFETLEDFEQYEKNKFKHRGNLSLSEDDDF